MASKGHTARGNDPGPVTLQNWNGDISTLEPSDKSEKRKSEMSQKTRLDCPFALFVIHKEQAKAAGRTDP